MISRITIIGTGLMGGSLGLALRAWRTDLTVVGCDDLLVLEQALEKGAITEANPDLIDSVRGAQVVVLATPIDAALEVLHAIGPHLEPGSLVTDLCSVKLPLSVAAQKTLPDNVLYVGGHPMTGSEKNGIQHASELLYENATFVVCGPDPIPETFHTIYDSFLELLTATGARLFAMTAREHDQIAARVSHVPQLLSVLLVMQASSSQDAWRELAAGGFKDMTRIASSSWTIWKDILLANREEIHRALTDMAARLESLTNKLASGDVKALENMFHSAEQARKSIAGGTKGFLKPLADIYVFIADKPGVLADITSTLSRHALNIKDIELLRIREDAGGTFRLGFDDITSAESAVQVLSDKGLTAYRL